MESQQTRKKALVLTVGTGDKKNLEKSLFQPLMKSIDKGTWDKVVLLPSQETTANAEYLIQDIGGGATIMCKPLGASGLETNVDECYGHFDCVLEDLINQGVDKVDITLDFTRGTKAMSAALLMVGVSREISSVRYVSGSQRDQRGMVASGSEKIEEVTTELVNTRRLLNQIERLMHRGSFESACLLLKGYNKHPETTEYLDTMGKTLQAIHAAARVYSAWDRFDYKDATNQWYKNQSLFGTGTFAPKLDACNWLEALATDIDRQDAPTAAIYVQRLACDMLANAERRQRDGLYEDAYVRSYRVLELIGQYCLFQRGYDSGQLPEDDDNIKQFENHLRKERSAVLGRRKVKNRSFATAGQFQVARLLKFLGDPRGKKLIKLCDKRCGFLKKNRNHSLLIHGFSAASTEQIVNLRASMDDLESFLLNDFPEAKDYLNMARSINFSPE